MINERLQLSHLGPANHARSRSARRSHGQLRAQVKQSMLYSANLLIEILRRSAAARKLYPHHSERRIDFIHAADGFDP